MRTIENGLYEITLDADHEAMSRVLVLVTSASSDHVSLEVVGNQDMREEGRLTLAGGALPDSMSPVEMGRIDDYLSQNAAAMAQLMEAEAIGHSALTVARAIHAMLTRAVPPGAALSQAIATGQGCQAWMDGRQGA